MRKKEIANQSNENSLENYRVILHDIQGILERAKSQAYKAVDNTKVQAYWQVGERIARAELENKARAEYGKHLVDKLSKDIGFSRRDIYRIIKIPKLRAFRCYLRKKVDILLSARMLTTFLALIFSAAI